MVIIVARRGFVMVFTRGVQTYTLIAMNPKRLARKVVPKGAIRITEETYRKSRVGVMHVRHGFPARGARVIAITGSNGKTSTACYLSDALKAVGYRTALYTTAVIEMDGARSINTNHTTVPKTGALFRFIAAAKKSRVDFVILEVTSHALHQHKLWGVPIEIAVMTNLSQDHLDYHGTMERYAAAKSRLFSAYMNPRTCILNADDEWYEYFRVRSAGRVVTYGKAKTADTRITAITSKPDGLTLEYRTAGHSVLSKSAVIGEFNGYNLAAVATVCEVLDIPPDTIRKALASVGAVPGRMEMVTSSTGFSAVVDYAHTPDAIEKALTALRGVASGKVSIVFGATGDRDKTKRPIMGQIAAKLADRVYLTDDETYTEDGDSIRKAVFDGIVEAKGRSKTIEIADRRQAISKALSEAGKGDMVLIAGLGHQNYRAMNEGNIAWQEVEVVKEVLRELGQG